MMKSQEQGLKKKKGVCVWLREHERFLKPFGKINGGRNFRWLSSSERMWPALFVDASLVIIMDDLRATGQR